MAWREPGRKEWQRAPQPIFAEAMVMVLMEAIYSAGSQHARSEALRPSPQSRVGASRAEFGGKFGLGSIWECARYILSVTR